MARKNKNKTSIGCLFWIALILLILVIFLFNRDTIQEVLQETGFIEFIKSNNEKPEVERVTPQEKDTVPQDADSSEIVITDQPLEPETSVDLQPPEKEPEEEIIALEVEQETSLPEKPETPPKEPQKVRRSNIYFILIGDSGKISLKKIVRPVYYSDSPLTETLKTLIQGLSGSELNMGLISLIPEQTLLYSASVKDGIAYLDFSEDFRFNSFGVEGYEAQLKQIVYTATEFASVKAVQILIEGTINDYMGSEGVYIGKPLSRDDF